jgi:hypothetical protein
LASESARLRCPNSALYKLDAERALINLCGMFKNSADSFDRLQKHMGLRTLLRYVGGTSETMMQEGLRYLSTQGIPFVSKDRIGENLYHQLIEMGEREQAESAD